MLALTDNATSVIRTITERQEAADGGLRIAAAGGNDQLMVSAAQAPAEGDVVIEDNGARVFVEPGVAGTLDGKVLDAQVDDEGSVSFLLAPQ